jgi:ribonuclease Z
MRPLFHPALVNGRSGDPALYIETLFESRALMFDLGDISTLAPRKIQRVSHIFVSHAHIDHFVGFDQLLRLLVGRDKSVHLYGPAGFTAHVHHKLHGYHWNLVDLYRSDLVFIVHELATENSVRTTRLRLKTAFAPEPLGAKPLAPSTLHSEPTFRVSTAVLEHRTPCLGFALQERTHINVWKTRLLERGLAVGPWLAALKRAVAENRPDDCPVCVDATRARQPIPLGELRELLTVTPGQKIAYVTDVADTPANRQAVIGLARGADILFIEAAFARADAALAAERAHLTTAAAGEIARAAAVRRVEPFHFSPRYAGEEARMLAEVSAAFAG